MHNDTSTTSTVTPPIACDLSVFTREERTAHLAMFRDVVHGRATSAIETATGVELHYADASVFTDLAFWAKDEQRCCPFLTFELGLLPDRSATLRISGPEGAKALLTSALELARRQ